MSNLEVFLITFIVTFFILTWTIDASCYVINKKIAENKKIMLQDGSFWIREDIEND